MATGRRLAILGLTLSLLAGCVSTGSLLRYRGTGVARCYKLEYETLWPAVEEAVRRVGLVIENANVENGFILARNYVLETRDPADMGLGADQGEAVAVFLEREGEDDIWAVEVVSRRRFALDPTPRDWTQPVFLAIEDRLPAEASAPNDDLAACARVRGLRTEGLRPQSGRGR